MYYMLHKLETGAVLYCTVLYCNSPGLQPSNTAAPAAPLDTVEPGWPSHRLQAPGYLLPTYLLPIYCLSTAYLLPTEEISPAFTLLTPLPVPGV